MEEIGCSEEDFEIQNFIHKNYKKNFNSDTEEKEYLELSLKEKILYAFFTSLFYIFLNSILFFIENLKF